MSYQGDFDPTGFDPANLATYPPLAAGRTGYEAGDWWYLTKAGVIEGVAVDVGDRVYPIGFGRRYGSLNYGDDVWGAELEGPWPAELVVLRPWLATNDPWDRPAAPYSGCPFGPSWPGWRIVVEMLFTDSKVARTYGALNFGDDVFGDLLDRGYLSWHDVTTHGFSAVIRHGARDGSPKSDVAQLQLDLRDLDADLISFATPFSWAQPGVGTMVRLSILSPQGDAFPLFAGRTEQIVDVHDAGARLLQLDAYGLGFDLVSTVPDWDRQEERASARLLALLDAVGWQWGRPLGFPADDPLIRRNDGPRPTLARTEADLVANSAGWIFDFTLEGRPRARRWPLEPEGAPLLVTECAGTERLVSHSIRVVGDTAETLNVVEVGSAAVQGAPALSAERESAPSILVAGRRSQSLGFPLTGLYSKQAELDALADRALARYGRVLNRVESFEADSRVDPRWLPQLAALDTGRGVEVQRDGLASYPLTIEAVVVGIEHRIIPDRWTSTVTLSTITESI